MILTKTPFRVSFFGGGTDYNPWFEKHGGLVVSSAFSKYCYISVRKLPPFFEHKTRIVYSKSEEVNEVKDIVHPGVRSCLQHMNISDGIEVHHDGDLPARSGIGSSSSFTVGFLKALYAYQNKMVSKKKLAEEAIHVEQNVEKQNVGIQDQILASYGGLQVIKMGPTNKFEVSPLILPESYKKNFESHIMLAFSGITRFASESASGKLKKMKEGSIDSKMFEIYDIAKEGLSFFQEKADIEHFGKLFDKTWQIKRTLSDDMTNEYIDNIYAVAKKAGAYGGRLLGAGGGGFIMLLAPPEKHEAIKEALSGAVKVWVPFTFDNEGSRIIYYEDQ